MILITAIAALGLAPHEPPSVAPASDAPPPTVRRAVPMGQLTIPDEIAPAVVPYLRCLYASRGVEIRSPDGTPQAATVPRGADCTSHRQQAAEAADRMLRDQGRGTRAERARFVGDVLTSIDNFAAQIGAASAQQGKSDASN